MDRIRNLNWLVIAVAVAASVLLTYSAMENARGHREAEVAAAFRLLAEFHGNILDALHLDRSGYERRFEEFRIQYPHFHDYERYLSEFRNQP